MGALMESIDEYSYPGWSPADFQTQQQCQGMTMVERTR
jgi:hypothetical protein